MDESFDEGTEFDRSGGLVLLWNNLYHSLTYLVEVQGGLKWKRHSDHLRDGSGVPPELLTTDLNDEILDDLLSVSVKLCSFVE